MGFGRVLRVQQSFPQNSVLVLLGQGRVLSGFSGSCPFPSHTTVPKITFTSTSDCPKKNILSTHCSPFVVDTIYQVFEYPSKPGCKNQMAASGSIAASRDLIVNNSITRVGDVSFSAKSSGFHYKFKSLQGCQKASLSLRNVEPAHSRLGSGSFMFNSLVGPRLKGVRTPASRCYSEGVLPDVSFDGSLYEEQIVHSAVSTEQNSPGVRTLKLVSGSCYLPHPDKEEIGGDDAHFICVEEQAIGVADGVGGWADVGVHAGLYSRELMSNSVAAILEQPKGLINPLKVLEKAHSITNSKGSSTACIIVLTDEQGIHAINLGDSGFIVVRDGCTIFQTPVQQHGFNFTYQLECGNRADVPSSGQVFEFPVAIGDVIVAGTDGLFDNLYNNEITAVVAHAVKDGLDPQVTAQKITALARQRAQDRTRQTPFSTAAQEAGFRYFGGKLDDITVVVSYITGSNT